MINLMHFLSEAPSNGDLVWNIDCPDLIRREISPQADIIQLDPSTEFLDRILFIPPVSGHSSTLIQDLAKPACRAGDVHVIDWRDPAFMPDENANYGHEDQVATIKAAILDALEQTSGRVHVVTICQSSSPTLIALDKMSGDRLTLTLIASPLFDAPGGVCDLFATPDATKDTLRGIRMLTSKTSEGVPVLAGQTQLAAILNGPGGALRILGASMSQECMPLFGNVAQSARHRRIALLDSQNIPERLLVEGLRSNFIERQHLSCEIDPSIPVHLVTGTEDQVVPPQQVLSFKEHFPRDDISISIFEGLDHFDLFAGSVAKSKIAPELIDFFTNPKGR